ncbi:MAG TPA: hypothetical protein VH934_05135 [Xanthobacteraceae bacterium]|jgi:hypothetical protein
MNASIPALALVTLTAPRSAFAWWRDRANSLGSIFVRGRRPMPTSEDYRQMANRSAQLAIACSSPSLAEALMALALDYARAASRSQRTDAKQQSMQQDASAGFGD